MAASLHRPSRRRSRRYCPNRQKNRSTPRALVNASHWGRSSSSRDGSAGGVQAFAEQYGPVALPAVAIGPVTARALERAGMPARMAPEISAAGLTRAVLAWVEERKK